MFLLLLSNRNGIHPVKLIVPPVCEVSVSLRNLLGDLACCSFPVKCSCKTKTKSYL